jgi:L-arabinose isomerase
MWIRGLSVLNKPLLHFHTQYNVEIPWSEIDMDFMNLNQSAHGDREFGYMLTRMRLNRKIVAGHWQDDEVVKKIGIWARAAAGWSDWQGAVSRGSVIT